MNVEEAIKTRRTIGRVKKDPVDRATIERVLEAAIWAPSHHNTQPWSFIVMTGEGRGRLGEGYARVFADSEAAAGLSGQALGDALSKERTKAFRSPVVIAAVCTQSDNPRAIFKEELAAVQAAVQNLLLAAHANELGAIWRSGDPMYHPLMRETLGLAEDAEIVGLIYLGYPDMTAPEPKRIPATAKTVWLE